jgi:hypothetical protein
MVQYHVAFASTNRSKLIVVIRKLRCFSLLRDTVKREYQVLKRTWNSSASYLQWLKEQVTAYNKYWSVNCSFHKFARHQGCILRSCCQAQQSFACTVKWSYKICYYCGLRLVSQNFRTRLAESLFTVQFLVRTPDILFCWGLLAIFSMLMCQSS